MLKPHPLRLAPCVFRFHRLYWSVLGFGTRRSSPLHPRPELFLTKDQSDEINDINGSRNMEVIGFLQYASIATRPDITYAVNKLAQFLANPGRARLDAALRVLHYLKGT